MLSILAITAILSADVPAYLNDNKDLSTQPQKDALVVAVKAHFGDALNLAAAQELQCVRATQGDSCVLREVGVTTRQIFANAIKAGIVARATSVNGDVVQYIREWRPVEITEGARRDSVVAYLSSVHPDVTLQFVTKLTVVRQPDGAIKSQAVYLSAIDELEIAAKQIDGTFHALAPNE